jgi:hypothetical protein
MYDDKDELIGIDKGVRIHLELENNQIVSVTSLINPKSTSYPDKDLPENARKLKGFKWRGEERVLTKDDIFPPEEKALHEAILRKTGLLKDKVDKPMEPMKATLDYDKNNPKPKAPVPSTETKTGS